MNVEAIFPECRVEPWHAKFYLGSNAEFWADCYRAANRYGESIVRVGLASRYFVVGMPDGCVHVIPTNDFNKHIIDYWNQIVDKNA